MSHLHNDQCRYTGRPRIEVAIEDIEFLRNLRFSWTRIAKILEISRSTLYRRLEDEGLARQLTFTNITDNDLDREVERIKRMHPNDGERLMIGHLTQRNIIVPRAKLRASIHRIDPVNTALRRSVTVRRRTYHSPGPNAVWHIDGNHKLIKWRLVIHGGIDGYSRTVVLLRCSDNNRADTVLSSFTTAVDTHGLPSRIRTDLGGENTEIWRYMVEQHASESAVITGASTHNERIERLWRDVYRCVGVLFADTFRKLEEDGNLDSLNEIDIYCLHYVYKARINSTLNAFIESWNNHPISTEGNLTPNQLFLHGALENNMFPQQPHGLFGQVSNTSNTPSNHIEVPRIVFQPCTVLCIQILTVNPLGPSNDFGCDIYLTAVNIIGQHLLQGCNDCIA